MIVHWSGEFDRWLTLEVERGGRTVEMTVAMLAFLRDLDGAPVEDTAHLTRITRSDPELWRFGHPADPSVTVTMTCWFPDDDTVVLTHFAHARHADDTSSAGHAVAASAPVVASWRQQSARPVVAVAS